MCLELQNIRSFLSAAIIVVSIFEIPIKIFIASYILNEKNYIGLKEKLMRTFRQRGSRWQRKR